MRLEIRKAESCLPLDATFADEDRNPARGVGFAIWRDESVQTHADRLRLDAEGDEREDGCELHFAAIIASGTGLTSFDNRLHDGVLKFVAHRTDGGLAHHDRDDFFFGIDPEVRAVDSAPAEAAVGNADVSGDGVLNHAHGEAEAFARRAAGKSVRN